MFFEEWNNFSLDTNTHIEKNGIDEFIETFDGYKIYNGHPMKDKNYKIVNRMFQIRQTTPSSLSYAKPPG